MAITSAASAVKLPPLPPQAFSDPVRDQLRATLGREPTADEVNAASNPVPPPPMPAQPPEPPQTPEPTFTPPVTGMDTSVDLPAEATTPPYPQYPSTGTATPEQAAQVQALLPAFEPLQQSAELYGGLQAIGQRRQQEMNRPVDIPPEYTRPTLEPNISQAEATRQELAGLQARPGGYVPPNLPTFGNNFLSNMLRGRPPLPGNPTPEEVDAAFKAFEENIANVAMGMVGNIHGPEGGGLRPRSGGTPAPRPGDFNYVPPGGAEPPRPPVEPPVPPVSPQPRAPLEAPTRTGERIAAGEILSPEARADFQEKASTYLVSSNAGAQAKARELINTDPKAAYETFMAVPETQALGNAVETSMGMQLAADLSEAARTDPTLLSVSRAINRRLAVRASVSGQGVQQLADWKNMGDAGIEYQVQKIQDAWLESGGDPKKLQQHMRSIEERDARAGIEANTARQVAEAEAKVAENQGLYAGQQAEIDTLGQRIKASKDVKEKADLQQQKQAAEKRLADFKYLTDQLIPEAKKRAVDYERKTMNDLRRVRREEGLPALPESIVRNFQGRAREAQQAPTEMQRQRLYEGIMQDMQNMVPPSQLRALWDGLEIPRQVQTAWDASYPFRQGMRTMVLHPVTWAKIWEPMFKAMKDPQYAAQVQDRLATRPLADIGHLSGLHFNEFGAAGVRSVEDYYGSKALGLLPGYKGSGRGYSVASNAQRTGLFDKMVGSWFPEGTDFSQIHSLEDAARISGHSVQDFHNAARLNNVLTGYGSIDWLKKVPGGLGNLILSLGYAPRWLVSKAELAEIMLNPKNGMSMRMRAEAAGNLASLYGTISGIIAAGAVKGIWDTDPDPRGVHFGDIRFKGTNTWIDLTGGLGPLIRLIGQATTGVTKTSTGQPEKTDMGAALGRFARGQLAPVPGALYDFYQGQNLAGQSRNYRNPTDVANGVLSLLTPISWHDLVQATYQYGKTDGLISGTSLFGTSTNTYSSFRDVQDKATREGNYIIETGPNAGKKAETYAELNDHQKEQVNATAPVKAETARIELGRQSQVDPKQDIESRFNAYKEATKWLETGNPNTPNDPYTGKGVRQWIDLGYKGKALNDKLGEFLADRAKLAAALFGNPEMQAYFAQRPQSGQIEDTLLAMWQGAQPTLREDGSLDYAPVDETHRRVLQMARDAGVRESYFTENRRANISDPVVRAAVEARDRDQETLRRYYNIETDLQQSNPAWAAAVRAGDTGSLAYRQYEQRLAYDRAQMKKNNDAVWEAGVRLYDWKDRSVPGERPARPTERPPQPQRPLSGPPLSTGVLR